MSGTLVAVEAGTPVKVCSVEVGQYCGRKAVEILHVRAYPGDPWEQAYRCDRHPASGDVKMISRAFPMAETRIEAIA